MRTLFLLFVFATAAHAHDFWMEPSTFRPAAGQVFTVSLRVGQNFIGDTIPRSASLIDSFVVREAGVDRTIGGAENQDPAGYARLLRSNGAIIGYTSKPYPLEISPEKFNEFLQQEGFDAVRSTQPHREHFSRFAKLIVGSGAGAFDRPFGWRFEIVPETDPLTLRPVRVRVLLDGKPAAGALITALHRDDPNARLTLRTDATGHVTLNLPIAGVWLVKCVALIPPQSAGDADWETLWASLTFER